MKRCSIFRISSSHILAKFERLGNEIRLETAEKLKNVFWSMTKKRIISLYIYLSIYISIYRERERERERYCFSCISRKLRLISKTGNCTFFCVAVYDIIAKSQLSSREIQPKTYRKVHPRPGISHVYDIRIHIWLSPVFSEAATHSIKCAILVFLCCPWLQVDTWFVVHY